jgi:hypothetical protein
LDGHTLEFIHQAVSTFGVTGLPWTPLDPIRHFGKEVTVQARIPSQPTPLAFSCPARVLREKTQYAEYMGLRFNLPADIKNQLDALIKKSGFYPTDYVRKYPRIPSEEHIQTFPLRAMGIPNQDDLSRRKRPTSSGDPILFDVGNLSPNGVLISTENQSAIDLIPGDRIDLMLEPRGWFPNKVELEGTICRIGDELVPATGNLRRYFGIKFTRVDQANRQVFLELLKDILERIKK